MSWFRCLICGENFPGQIIGQVEMVGFFVTRYVEAKDVAGAKIVALHALRADPKLSRLLNDSPLEQPQVYIEEIEEVAEVEVPQVQLGFSWYPM